MASATFENAGTRTRRRRGRDPRPVLRGAGVSLLIAGSYVGVVLAAHWALASLF